MSIVYFKQAKAISCLTLVKKFSPRVAMSEFDKLVDILGGGFIYDVDLEINKIKYSSSEDENAYVLVPKKHIEEIIFEYFGDEPLDNKFVSDLKEAIFEKVIDFIKNDDFLKLISILKNEETVLKIGFNKIEIQH